MRLVSRPSDAFAGFLKFTLGPMKRSKKILTRSASIVLEPLFTLLGYLLGQSFKIPAVKVVLCQQVNQVLRNSFRTQKIFCMRLYYCFKAIEVKNGSLPLQMLYEVPTAAKATLHTCKPWAYYPSYCLQYIKPYIGTADNSNYTRRGCAWQNKICHIQWYFSHMGWVEIVWCTLACVASWHLRYLYDW